MGQGDAEDVIGAAHDEEHGTDAPHCTLRLRLKHSHGGKEAHEDVTVDKEVSDDDLMIDDRRTTETERLSCCFASALICFEAPKVRGNFRATDKRGVWLPCVWQMFRWLVADQNVVLLIVDLQPPSEKPCGQLGVHNCPTMVHPR